ncbi:MAG: hypothetical protein IPP86_02440 [Bacteroidetes bacterium]|nr:hypothetical protein [Bacteroidota bacterium]
MLPLAFVKTDLRIVICCLTSLFPDGRQNYAGGPTEYPQTGAGADNGHLRVTGSTPKIGYGPCAVEVEQNGNHWFV